MPNDGAFRHPGHQGTQFKYCTVWHWWFYSEKNTFAIYDEKLKDKTWCSKQMLTWLNWGLEKIFSGVGKMEKYAEFAILLQTITEWILDVPFIKIKKRGMWLNFWRVFEGVCLTWREILVGGGGVKVKNWKKSEFPLLHIILLNVGWRRMFFKYVENNVKNKTSKFFFKKNYLYTSKSFFGKFLNFCKNLGSSGTGYQKVQKPLGTQGVDAFSLPPSPTHVRLTLDNLANLFP